MINIYLDQNHWINLAKALYRNDTIPEERETATYLESLAEQEVVRFPVSDIHIIEGSKISNPEQRQRLAMTYAKFSRGWFLVSRQSQISNQLQTALAKLLSIESSNTSSFSPFAREMLLAFGDYSFLAPLLNRSEARIEQISKIIDPTFAICSYLSFEDEDCRKNVVKVLTESINELISRIDERRSKMSAHPADLRLRAYSALLFLETQDKIGAALKQLGKTFDDLRTLPDEQIAGLLDKVPCLDVERRLAIRLDQQSNRDTKVNDVYDIAFLTGAIPYCDVVVTERLLVHLCKVSGITQKYNTTMLSSIRQLQEYICSMS